MGQWQVHKFANCGLLKTEVKTVLVEQAKV